MLIGILLLAAIPAAAQETITIASGNFAEPQLLAEAIKILIEENTDLTVDHVRNFSGSSLLHSAFLAGDVDLYISYTGTQFTGVLGMEVTDDWKTGKRSKNLSKRSLPSSLTPLGLTPLDSTTPIQLRCAANSLRNTT